MTDDGFEIHLGIPINLSRGNCPHCGKELVVKIEKPKGGKVAEVVSIDGGKK